MVPTVSAKGRVRAGLLQFFGDIGRGVPAAVGQVNEEQAEDELRGDGVGGGAHRRRRKMMPVAVADGKGQDDEGNQSEDLGSGQHVLQPRHALHAENIDGGKQQHQQARRHLRPAESKFPIARTEQHARVFQMERRKELRQIVRERQSRQGDGRRESREERNPAGHESPGGAEGLREVNVLAAGAGHVDAELGITERAG